MSRKLFPFAGSLTVTLALFASVITIMTGGGPVVA